MIRVACRIFGQDMALCIFRKKSPSFSPLSFDVLTPCYDACWEAGSKEECLTQLQSLPKQMPVSTALKLLGSEHSESIPTLEVSAYGMFILILSESEALCCCIPLANACQASTACCFKRVKTTLKAVQTLLSVHQMTLPKTRTRFRNSMTSSRASTSQASLMCLLISMVQPP